MPTRAEGEGKDRWKPFVEDLARFVREVIPEDRVPEGEVTAAEERLGFRLPAALREYYLRFGAPNEINTANDELLAPGKLYVQDGLLVFYRENQGVVVWAIAMDEISADFPRIWCAENDKPLKPKLDFDDPVGFFRAMMCMQLALGYRFQAIQEPVPEGALENLSTVLPLLELPGSHWPKTRIFGGNGTVVVLLGDQTLAAMGRAQADLDWIGDQLAAEWLQTGDVIDGGSFGGSPADYARDVIRARRATADRERRRLERVAENNRRCSEFAATLREAGLKCPHCGSESKSHRFEYGTSEMSFFVCRCGRSFNAEQLGGS